MSRRIVAIVPDLFFATKIAATAAAAGVALESASFAQAPARIGAAPAAGLVILDLAAGAPALELARALKADPATRAIPIAGFYSHVDAATREAALAAGIDHVLPRSAFVARLPLLLRGEPSA